ncbi:MAG TPA: hypothetical protein PLI30_10535 [Petrimonas sp.]|nr:hypothetical protein [Petrimonas sp.]
MKNKLYIGLAWATIFFASSSCSEDYIIGGEVNETKQLNMTTFDLLKSMEETKNVAILFERAGMKELVNGDVTIISPSQWSINRYLRRKHNQNLRNNPSAPPVTMDDISAQELQKMGMYILPGKYWRETIPAEGINLVAHDGTEVRLTLDKTNTDPGAAWDGSGVPGSGYQYSNFMQQVPYLVKVHFKRGANWEMTPDDRNRLTGYYDNPECDHVYRMYVSDILTSTGVVHVIYSGDYGYSDHYYYHSLFFFGLRTDDKL